MEKYNYKNLKDFLDNQKDIYIKITYIQLEEILEKELPISAYKYEAYFSNSMSHKISSIWIEKEYKKIELVLGEYLVLKKVE